MTKKNSILLLLLCLCVIKAFAQAPIEVADNTIKINAKDEAVFYYGFSEGDQLIFSFEEMHRKELTEVEISELTGSSKFMDYKTKTIENKKITVAKTGIYKFRMANLAHTNRVCKIKIQRIPSNAFTPNFNSSVYWRTVQDTTYLVSKKKQLLKRDTIIQTLVEQNSRINGTYTLGGTANKTYINFTLPNGTVSWSYYIGVGTKGKELFSHTKNSFINTAAAAASHIPGYGTMAALALYGVNLFTMVQGEDNVKYWFISDESQLNLFKTKKEFTFIRMGNVINEAAQMKKPLAGEIYLALMNNNILDAMDVMVNITAVIVREQWSQPIRQIENIHSGLEPYLDN